MANSKRRCTVCREYFPVDELTILQGMQAVCDDDSPLLFKLKQPQPSKTKKKRSKGKKRGRYTGASPQLKRQIRSRDGMRCRFCTVRLTPSRAEVHHIKYLSQGGPNHECNLITLCDEHHRLVHSNKRLWQPILLAAIWIQYVGLPDEKPKRLTVNETARILRRLGMHPEQQPGFRPESEMTNA